MATRLNILAWEFQAQRSLRELQRVDGLRDFNSLVITRSFLICSHVIYMPSLPICMDWWILFVKLCFNYVLLDFRFIQLNKVNLIISMVWEISCLYLLHIVYLESKKQKAIKVHLISLLTSRGDKIVSISSQSFLRHYPD